VNTENKFPREPILIVDDEEQCLYSIGLSLRAIGITNVLTCLSGEKAIVLDINLPDIRGTELLDMVLDVCPETPVVMITAVNQADVAVECMKKGAMDYLVKPFDEDKMLAIIKNALAQGELRGENEALKQYLLGSELKNPEAFSAIVTNNSRMRTLFQYAEAIASTPFPILITGETGVGKDLFARAVHDLSGRIGEFVVVNAAGIDENSFSDTLFGHIKGAFTGADRSRPGLIEQAAGGTLFLDEIGDLSQGSQIKLLRVIQNRDYLPLGADAARLADVRIIVATNKRVEELKLSASFRSDLYHRLRTHHIAIPPLRNRLDDLPILVEFFLADAAEILHKRKPTVPRELLSLLNTYSFPGNIRELRAMLFDAVSVHKSKVLSAAIFREWLGSDKNDTQPDITIASGTLEPALRFDSRIPTIQNAVRSLINEALSRSGNNQNAAAKLLGISPQALSRRLKHARSSMDT
jgi:DNA-binding NtrC family response regulator